MRWGALPGAGNAFEARRGEQRLELNICLRSKHLPGRPLPAQLWHTLTYSGHAMFGYNVIRVSSNIEIREPLFSVALERF
jgi:hypothetical protein